MRQEKGFTLIELMVVVAIVGILAAIAYPSYREYVMRGRIAEATSVLSDMRIKIEQYYADNKTYVGYSCTSTANLSSFTVSCPGALTATTYTIEAAGRADAGMSGFRYTINQAGAKASNTPWGNQDNCWVTRKEGQC